MTDSTNPAPAPQGVTATCLTTAGSVPRVVKEDDKGNLLCADCNHPVGLYLDRETDVEFVCCDKCWWVATVVQMEASENKPAA